MNYESTDTATLIRANQFLVPQTPRELAELPVLQNSPAPENDLPLGHYWRVLKDRKWLIAGIVAAFVTLTIVISGRLQPIYEATATVDVDRQAPSDVVGQESSRNSVPNDADQFLATQQSLLESDSVLRPVAQKYNLLSREGQLKDLTPEQVKRAVGAPVVLKKLKIKRAPNTYLLLVSYRSPDPALSADVANAVAQSYLKHTWDLRIRSSANLSSFMGQQLDGLKAKMERSSQALGQFERELNMINPEQKTSILSARLLQLNTEYTNAQADRVKSEAEFHSVLNGKPEALLASAQAEPLKQLQEKLNGAQQQFAQVNTTYGANHPLHKKAAADVAELTRQFEVLRANIASRIEVDYQRAVGREQLLHQTLTETKAEFDGLNEKSFQYQRLKQEADADKALYDELIKKIQEAGINSGFQNNNIRIADPARPASKPVFPNMILNVALAFITSLVLAIAIAVITDVTDTSVQDPDSVRLLGAELVGVLPAVKEKQFDLAHLGLDSNGTDADSALVPASGGDGRSISAFEEAVRTVRNSILLSSFDRQLGSLLITSASPGEGKTTTAIHLAVANAQQQRRTLLIDADLRRPTVHTRLKLKSDSGLSAVATGLMSWQEVRTSVQGLPFLDVIPAGVPSRRAADLVGPTVDDLLRQARSEYDLVILDAPPLLGFAESLQLSTICDGTVVVSRVGSTQRKAILAVLSSLRRLRVNVVGLILNGVKPNGSGAYGYYGYGGYGYYSSSPASSPE